MSKDNYYVAFVHVYDEKTLITAQYGDLHIYQRDTGKYITLPHIAYYELNDCYNEEGPDYTRSNRVYIKNKLNGVWDNMSDIIDVLKDYIHYHGYVIDTKDMKITPRTYIEFIGDNDTDNIAEHHSFLIRDTNGARVYLGNLTADKLHDDYTRWIDPNALDLDKRKSSEFESFIKNSLKDIPGLKYTPFDTLHNSIWKYYRSKVSFNDVAKKILKDTDKDRHLPQDIVIQKYDENPVVFKDNVDALVDEVNHNYDLLQANLKTMGFELKKITKDENPSEMDELMTTCEYLRKNIVVSFVKMPETRGDYKITLCNINDPSGIIYKCPDEITVKSVRENLKPESKGSRFYKLFSTVKDMYTDLKCEYIPATDIMGYISSEYNRTVMCSAQLPVATRQIKSDLFKIVLNAFPVTYNGKDDLEFTITLYHMNTGVVYIIILPGQLFTASQVLEYTKSLQDYRDMIHDPIRSQKTKIFETRILDLLRTASEDFNMNDVMELIYGAYAISVNHRIKNW